MCQRDRPPVCPYYVGLLTGRCRSAILCFDYGGEDGVLPKGGGRVYFGQNASFDANTVCFGRYEGCQMHQHLSTRGPGGEEDAAGPIRKIVNAMILDAFLARQDT